MKEDKQPCQKKSVGFDLKLRIVEEVCNGQISVNYAAKKYLVGRNAIYYWIKKYATLDQQNKAVAKKDELKKLKEEIERLQFIKEFQQEFIAELSIEAGLDLEKKFLPDSLMKEIELKRKAVLKNNGSTNASGSQDKRSNKK